MLRSRVMALAHLPHMGRTGTMGAGAGDEAAYVLAAGQDGSVVLVHVDSATSLHVFAAHRGAVTSLSVQLQQAGQELVLGGAASCMVVTASGDDNTVKVWGGERGCHHAPFVWGCTRLPCHVVHFVLCCAVL